MVFIVRFPFLCYFCSMREYLYLAPLQSLTDFHFRNAFQQNLGDVDRFYAPYLKMNNDGTIKEGPKKDILPALNPFEKVVPQLMACSSADFLLMADYIESLGYEELNWNLGCPYPMVAKRNLGSGILTNPQQIFSILEEVIPKTSLKIGLKMRMGYESTEEILSILPSLNAFPLTEIIVHARYGKQLYQGGCDYDRFEEIIPLTTHRLIYNGDIISVDSYRSLKSRFPSIHHWMIGRGAIANPFLFEMIQEDSDEFPEDWNEVWISFITDLVESIQAVLPNDSAVLRKLEQYFTDYFSEAIPNAKMIARKLKKQTNLNDFFALLEETYLTMENE